jgi:hypothetical protein
VDVVPAALTDLAHMDRARRRRARFTYGLDLIAMARCRAAHAAIVVAAIGLLDTGCSPAAPPLAHTQASPREVGQRLLEAIASGDRPALARLALDEAEFRAHVWPDLPAARPERNLPFGYVWGDLHQKSEISLTRMLQQHQGQRYALVDVRFGEAPEAYRTYTVHGEPVLVVRGADGVTTDLRVCGSLLEKQGQWKVFSYVIAD